jgi:hypothetical protein
MELAKKLFQDSPLGKPARPKGYRGQALDVSTDKPDPPTGDGMEKFQAGICQWAMAGSGRFVPTARTTSLLPVGLYAIEAVPEIGLYFRRIEVKTEGLLRLPHTNSEQVLTEVQNFWSRSAKFEEFGLAQKRGIMLWGPPGSGKSSTIQLVMKDVVERGGIGIIFGHPGKFVMGMRMLREIQPEAPVVVLMEDIDEIIHSYDESTVLNVLDGAERIEKVVFIASTNYPENLGPRIINRPSRFDRRFKIDHPNAESREVYLKHLIGDHEMPKGHDVYRWVTDTEGMSLAHLRELFVATVVLEHPYQETIEMLRHMRERISSEHDREGMMGLHRGASALLAGYVAGGNAKAAR